MILRENNKIIIINRSDFISDIMYYKKIYNIIGNSTINDTQSINDTNIKLLNLLILFYK